jgi:hypothetical protein
VILVRFELATVFTSQKSVDFYIAAAGKGFPVFIACNKKGPLPFSP